MSTSAHELKPRKTLHPYERLRKYQTKNTCQTVVTPRESPTASSEPSAAFHDTQCAATGPPHPVVGEMDVLDVGDEPDKKAE